MSGCYDEHHCSEYLRDLPISAEQARRLLSDVLKGNPTVTCWGIIQRDHGESLETYEARARKWRATSFNLRSFALAYLWCLKIPKRKGFNYRRGSYGLKHTAERDIGTYISNGTFIAAAIAAGFRWQARTRWSPNAEFNMQEGALAAIEKDSERRCREESLVSSASPIATLPAPPVRLSAEIIPFPKRPEPVTYPIEWYGDFDDAG